VGHALRPRPADRLLLWFGLVSAIYGIRMFFKQPLAASLGIDPVTGAWVENGLNYFILVPSLLFVEELYGRGWRNLVHWVTIAVALFATSAVLVDAMARDPTRVPDPSLPVVVMVIGIVVIGANRGYRPPRFDEWPVLLAGIFTFMLFVLNEHAVGAGVVPWRFAAEPVGFVIQLGCFGYIALTRVFAQGRQLAAVEHEMRSAREIQHSILPRILPSTDRVRIAARYEPLAAVAGDFYDAVALDQGAVALLVADVSGHGVPAALIASMVKVAFAAALSETIDPGGVLERMNKTLGGMFERSYVTAACVFVEPDTRILKYALAGHPPPLIVNGNSDVVRLDQRGLFLGMFPSATYKTETITLEAGSRVLMYTDGVTETADRHEELFGIDRLMAFVAAKRTQLPAHFADALVTTLLDFSGRTTLVHDDVTILVADVD